MTTSDEHKYSYSIFISGERITNYGLIGGQNNLYKLFKNNIMILSSIIGLVLFFMSTIEDRFVLIFF